MAEVSATTQSDSEKIGLLIKGIGNGSRALQLYLDICAKCGMCATQCHVSRADPQRRTNPAARADLMRRLYKHDHSFLSAILRYMGNRERAGLNREDLEQWARDFYECSGCRRCAVYCPFGIDNSVITRTGRGLLHSLGMSPKSLVKTQETADQLGNGEGQNYEAFMEAIRFLESELAEEHGMPIKIPVDQEAEILFVPPGVDLISYPETMMGYAAFFHAAGLNWTMSSQAFDAANYGLFTGDDLHLRRKNEMLHRACINLKVKRLVIGECGHAYRVAKRIGGPFLWGKDIPYEIASIFILGSEELRKGTIHLDPRKNPEPVTYHDPCNLARSCGVTEEPRELLKACVMDFREMTPNREHNWCCGGGGGLAVMDGKEGVTKKETTFFEYRMSVGGKMKLNQVRETEATYLAAPCGNCKRQLIQLMEYHGTGVRVGGVFELLDKALILKR